MVAFPIEMPAAPAFASSSLRIVTRQIKQESPSGIATITRHPGDRWEGTLTLPPLTANQAQDWLGFFYSLEGAIGSFWLPHPDFTAARGSVSGVEGMVAEGGQIGALINTHGWPTTQPTGFRRGDILEIDGKMKSVVRDQPTSGTTPGYTGGVTLLEVQPPFYTSPAAGAAVKTVAPRGVFRLASGDIDVSADHLRHHRLTFAVEEVLP